MWTYLVTWLNHTLWRPLSNRLLLPHTVSKTCRTWPWWDSQIKRGTKSSNLSEYSRCSCSWHTGISFNITFMFGVIWPVCWALCSHSDPLSVIFRLSSQVMARGGSFGMPATAATPLHVTRQGSPASPSLLHHAMPGSPALAHIKAQGQGSAPSSPLFHSLSPSHPSPLHGSPARTSDISLSNVHVPLEAIRPSKRLKEWWPGQSCQLEKHLF